MPRCRHAARRRPQLLTARVPERHEAMNTKPAPDAGHHRSVVWYRSPGVVAGLMLAAIALFFLLREHWAHVSGNWVYLILLLCPLMHLFGHGGHHGGHGSNDHDAEGR